MNSKDPNFDWHVNGLYVALGPDNGVYTDTAASTAHGARAALLTHTNKPWSKLQELGYSIQGYVIPVQQAACTAPPAGWSCSRAAGHEGPCAAKPLEVPTTAISLIDNACDALLRARARLTTMQVRHMPGSQTHRDIEDIDDEIHNALTALGQ